MATPARSFELPRATPSSSAKALLMWSARALAAVSTSVWLAYGTPTPYRVALPKVLARLDGLVPTEAELVPADAVPMTVCFCDGSQPLHLDLADLVGRRDHAPQTQDVSAHGEGQGVVGIGQAPAAPGRRSTRRAGGNRACRRRPGPRNRRRPPAFSGTASRCCCSATHKGTPGWWSRSGPAASWPAAATFWAMSAEVMFWYVSV